MTSSNVGLRLISAAERWPDAVALVDYGDCGPDGEPRRWTWQALAHRARTLAGAIADAQLPPDQPIALMGRNGAEYVARWFAVALVGRVLVPIPTQAAPAELAERMATCGLILHDHETTELVQTTAAAMASDECGAPAVWGPIVAQSHRMLEMISSKNPEDPALLLYTSGTTGASKGALISHGALVTHTRNVCASAVLLGPSDVVLAALPFSHSFGLRMVLLACATSGARMVSLPKFTAPLAWRAMVDQGVTWLPVVPTMLAALVRAPQTPRPPSLRWSLSAGATLPEAQRMRASEVLGAPVYQGYGMTEATFSTIDHPPAEPTPGSVGKPVHGVQVRVVGEDGQELRAGERGEVWIRGANTFLRYLDAPEATQAVKRDGWVRSGDIGVRDATGRLAIVDRKKDLIISGGFNVYPSEVESVIQRFAGVHQVAVVAMPDAYLGEVAVAVLVTSEAIDLSQLHLWLAQRLTRYKLPRRYAETDALPLGPSRKVQKRRLRAALVRGDLKTRDAAPQKRAYRPTPGEPDR
ncbi:MAG: AMP-binding protein [Myxococcales bacterium]|nr:AMP-binding protein [Myxococcales bacterium]